MGMCLLLALPPLPSQRKHCLWNHGAAREQRSEGLITGLGLVLGHFGEGSRKQAFGLDWMLLRSEAAAVTGILMLFF